MSTRTRQWGPCLAERIDSVTDKPAQSEEGWGKGQEGEKKGLGKGGVGDSRCCQGYGSRKETEKERERKRKRRRKEGKVKVDGRKKVRERQRRGGGSNANRPDCNENAADREEKPGLGAQRIQPLSGEGEA